MYKVHFPSPFQLQSETHQYTYLISTVECEHGIKIS